MPELDGGYNRGSTQVTLFGGKGIKEGQYIILDQTTILRPTAVCLYAKPQMQTHPVHWEGVPATREEFVDGVARQQAQIVKVIGINGRTSLSSLDLYSPNWSAKKSPGAFSAIATCSERRR